MRPVVAGLDIGNATTEVVLVDGDGWVVAAGRAPTRGVKGSAAAIAAAAALVDRTARRAAVEISAVHVALLRPVRTRTLRTTEAGAVSGPVRVLRQGAATAAGDGVGAGTPWPVERDPGPNGSAPGPHVVVVPAHMPFREAARRINYFAASGLDVVGVCVEADEAVLIGARLRHTVPVVDGVPATAATGSRHLAVEVRQPGHPLQGLTDAFWMASTLGLDPKDAGHLAGVAASLDGASNAVVMLDRPEDATHRPVTPAAPVPAPRIHIGDAALDVNEAAAALARIPPGPPLAIDLGDGPVSMSDIAAVDVADLLHELRRGRPRQEVALATLASEHSLVDPADALTAALGAPVRVIGSEAAAARAGALTTPGADGALVIDLGAGTIDVVDAPGHVTVAGSGDLLTAVVAAALGASKAIAEYAKREPAVRVDGPDLATTEDGTRIFLARRAAGHAVGRLCATGPLGLVPLSTTWSPAEWRGVRRRAKAAVIGAGVRRAMTALPQVEQPRAVCLVGGPAADEEVLAALSEALAPDTPLGRGAVAFGRLRPDATIADPDLHAGSLGHRFAVAYGLATSTS